MNINEKSLWLSREYFVLYFLYYVKINKELSLFIQNRLYWRLMRIQIMLCPTEMSVKASTPKVSKGITFSEKKPCQTENQKKRKLRRFATLMRDFFRTWWKCLKTQRCESQQRRNSFNGERVLNFFQTGYFLVHYLFIQFHKFIITVWSAYKANQLICHENNISCKIATTNIKLS